MIFLGGGDGSLWPKVKTYNIHNNLHIISVHIFSPRFCPPLTLDSAPQLRGMGAGPKKIGVTSAVSDESVAGDSGVYEPSERKYKEFHITHFHIFIRLVRHPVTRMFSHVTYCFL